MKKAVFCLLLALALVNYSYAAYPVKSATATTNEIVPVAASGEDKSTVTNHEHASFTTRIRNRVLSIFGDFDRGMGEPGEGDRAFFWGMWGILLWPLGVLAIVHGIRGLRSRSGRQQDMATLGLILGIGEVLACILAVVFFFAFFLY